MRVPIERGRRKLGVVIFLVSDLGHGLRRPYLHHNFHHHRLRLLVQELRNDERCTSSGASTRNYTYLAMQPSSSLYQMRQR